MADSEVAAEGGAPVASRPKRPTIIRPTLDGKGTARPNPARPAPARPNPARPAPARPAPTPPGSRSTSPAAAHSTASTVVPQRPAPAALDAASSTPPLKRPDPPAKDIGRPKSQGSVRKRPEITIVDARPMSQAGFRDLKGGSLMPSTKVASTDGSITALPRPLPATGPLVPPPEHAVPPANPPPIPSSDTPPSDSFADNGSLGPSTRPARPTILRPPTRPKSMAVVASGHSANAEDKLSPPPPLPKRSPIMTTGGACGDLVSFEPPPKPERTLSKGSGKEQQVSGQAIESQRIEGAEKVESWSNGDLAPKKPLRTSVIRPPPRPKLGDDGATKTAEEPEDSSSRQRAPPTKPPQPSSHPVTASQPERSPPPSPPRSDLEEHPIAPLRSDFVENPVAPPRSDLVEHPVAPPPTVPVAKPRASPRVVPAPQSCGISESKTVAVEAERPRGVPARPKPPVPASRPHDRVADAAEDPESPEHLASSRPSPSRLSSSSSVSHGALTRTNGCVEPALLPEPSQPPPPIPAREASHENEGCGLLYAVSDPLDINELLNTQALPADHHQPPRPPPPKPNAPPTHIPVARPDLSPPTHIPVARPDLSPPTHIPVARPDLSHPRSSTLSSSNDPSFKKNGFLDKDVEVVETRDRLLRDKPHPNAACAQDPLALPQIETVEEITIYAKVIKSKESHDTSVIKSRESHDTSVIKSKESHDTSVIKSKESHNHFVIEAKESHDTSVGTCDQSRSAAPASNPFGVKLNHISAEGNSSVVSETAANSSVVSETVANSSVESETAANSFVVSETAAKPNRLEAETRKSQSRPKPTIAHKPQTAAKPKSPNAGQVEPEAGVRELSKAGQLESEAGVRELSKAGQLEPEAGVRELSKAEPPATVPQQSDARPSACKRPTVIRPQPKPLLAPKTENEDQIGNDVDVRLREKTTPTQSVPQSDLADGEKKKNASGPPPAAPKRPVTVIGFPHRKPSPQEGEDRAAGKTSSPVSRLRQAPADCPGRMDATQNGSDAASAEKCQLPAADGLGPPPPHLSRHPPPRPDCRPPKPPGESPRSPGAENDDVKMDHAASLDSPSSRSGPPWSTQVHAVPPWSTQVHAGPPEPANRPTPATEASGEEDSGKRPPRPSGPPPARPVSVPSLKPPPASAAGRPVSIPPVKPPNASAASRSSPHPAGTKSEKPPRSQPVRPAAHKEGKMSAPPPLPLRPRLSHPLYTYMAAHPHAIALYDYPTSQQDELAFEEGDLVMLVKRVDCQWLLGQAGDRQGIFPQSFVNVIHPLHDELPTSAIDEDDLVDSVFDNTSEEKPDNLHGPRCRARFDFDGEGHDDLEFEDGDVIQLVARCGSDWLKGKLNGKVGLFPASFVEIIEDLSPEDTSQGVTASVWEVNALFDFSGELGELSFQAGDKIHILGKVDDQWLFGECNGCQGSFPSSFADHIPHDLLVFESHQTASASAETTLPVAHALSSRKQFATALYNFEKGQECDLEFQTGDRIEILEDVGGDWLKGRIDGRQGIFPASFVEWPSEEAAWLGADVGRPESALIGSALFDFDGETAEELTFKEGDEIVLGEMVAGGSHWQWGQLHGHTGMFPTSFVRPL